MVIVVQFYAADQDAPWDDVGARISTVVIAIAPVVPDAVDHPGSQHGDPQHLDRPNDRANTKSKQDPVSDQHDAATLPREPAVDVALDPVFRRAMAIAGNRV